MKGQGVPVAAGVYVRISSDPELTRLGVQRQEQDCREYVERQGWSLANVYEDNDVSAYNGHQRPAYRRLLEDIRSGAVKVVVAWHPDRLHRSPRELEEFIEVVDHAGCRVETVRAGQLDFATPTGRMVARLLGATARYESEHKAERIRRKHQELALRGMNAGGGRPFGYEGDRKSVRPAEAALVREAARRFLTGEPLRAIVRDWTARQVKTVTGAAWSVQVMRRMLASARISGRREYRRKAGRTADMGTITSDKAEWATIISPVDSDVIRSLLVDPDRRKNGYARDYLLTGGIARCALCGRSLVARPRGDKRRSMVCASGPGFHGCGKIRTLADPVEELVTEAVLRRIDSGGLGTAMARQDDPEATEGLLVLESKLAELARHWAEDRITRAEWQAARAVLENGRVGFQRRVEATRRTRDLDGLPDPLRPSWSTLPLFKKRAVLQAFVEAVDLQPAVKGRNFFDRGRVSIRWKA
jgi:DNA invertase Pin-like site-specific DNA recombinase